LFSLQNIVLNYGDLKVLDQFNLSCDKRQFICLFGPSGVGKSSILNILAGIIKPQSGQVSCNNQRLAYVFQEPRLLPWFTVEQNLQIGLYSLGLSAKQRHERVKNLLPLLNLAEFADYYPRQLSGGMKQRVSIGRAFAIQPDLLLLDEPFCGLDESLKQDMQELLDSLQKWHPCTKVMVTHDVNEAIKLSDRIVVLQGRPCQVALNLYPDPTKKLDLDYVQQTKQILLNSAVSS
jgi:ABC-type nitrate/sulfonate/bicarbonate transport system ATPase subunit